MTAEAPATARPSSALDAADIALHLESRVRTETADVSGAAYDAFILTVATALVSLANLAFGVLAARIAGSRQYGEAGVLLALGTAGGFIAVGAQYAMAERASRYQSTAGVLIRQALAAVAPWAVIGALLLAAAPTLSGYLHLDSVVPVVLGVLLFGVLVTNASLGGVLIGHRRFHLLAALMVMSSAIRLILVPVFARGSHAAAGALIASLVPVAVIGGAAVIAILAWTPTRHARPRSADRPRRTASPVAVDAFRGAILAAGIWGTWTLPLAIGRHMLGSAAAGNLTAEQLLATGVLYSANGLLLVAFSRLVSGSGTFLATRGLIATVVLLGLGCAVLVASGPAIVSRLYGAQYVGSRVDLMAMSASVLAVGAANYAAWAQRAMGQRFFPAAGALMVGLFVESIVASVGPRTIGALSLGPMWAVAAAIPTYAVLLGLRNLSWHVGWQRGN